MFWSDCAYAHADLRLRSARIYIVWRGGSFDFFLYEH